MASPIKYVQRGISSLGENHGQAVAFAIDKCQPRISASPLSFAPLTLTASRLRAYHVAMAVAPHRFFVYLLVLLAPFARGTEESPLSNIIDSAVALSGYARPNTTLQVQLVDAQRMASLVCNGRSRCPIYAAYHDDDILYVRQDLDDPNLADHLRFHEVIHWLQHHSGNFSGSDCATLVAREREAYRLENRYIVEIQHGFALMVIPPYDCPVAAAG
jgi:hypothetical protein